jgi:hypothetical protein
LRVSAGSRARVDATVEASGGLRPYTYVWTGSNPTTLTNRGASISYAPMVRAVPRPGSRFTPDDTLPGQEDISVTVIDADGVAVHASQVVAVLAHPFIPGAILAHGVPTYGCESPGEPEMWTQERVGWQQGMANSGGGTERFCWLGNASWPGDYIKPVPAGSLPASPWIYGDADYLNWGANTANLVLINGDGWPDGFTAMFPGAPQSDYNTNVFLAQPTNPGWTVQIESNQYSVNYKGSWGPIGSNDCLYWLVGLLCDCFDGQDATGWPTAPSRWLPAFGGLHMFTGFASGAAYSAGAFPKAFAERILGVNGSPEPILDAWLDASTATGEGTAAAMGLIGVGGVTDMSDHYIGQGAMGPTISPANAAGWWFVRQ